MYQLEQNTSNTILLNTPFQIVLEEQTAANHQWELVASPNFQLISANYTVSPNKHSTLIRTWELQARTPGTFRIICNYRKLCCSRNISRTLTFEVIVLG